MIIGLQFVGVNRLIAMFLKMLRRLGEPIRNRLELAEVGLKKIGATPYEPPPP